MAASGRGTAQASWLELFFDLVAVAGVALIAHLLHGAPDLADVGLYALLFLAFWTAWVCFTLYAYVADEDTRARTVLAAMFGMAVMAAAVPGVHEGDDQQARVFALAYILTRGLANRAWQYRRQILVDRPAAQMSLGVIPWIVSIWAHDPVRYWLWALGITLDLYVTFVVSARGIVERQAAHGRRDDRHSRPGAVGLGLSARFLGRFPAAPCTQRPLPDAGDRRRQVLPCTSFDLSVAKWSRAKGN
ncbi:low temperature requirement protein A [Streptomyces sp. NBC_00452]|uniref:low temperature requirement protein A n=1 Tax=Streptomyces sp. NBC_00452 TaxID=2975746 RepID=UPI00224F20C3|nr:low temperature requirement protein A [Streptomyces sp. NBC_00452]MCX5064140.1 low temperature requirement protein A [Streptomyces sp. NBC_00452]